MEGLLYLRHTLSRERRRFNYRPGPARIAATGYRARLPVTGNRLPVTGYRINPRPVTGYRIAITSRDIATG